jgi:hypothetical protein
VRWSSDAGYSWAVCEPTTGKLLAEVTLGLTTGDIGTRALDGHACAAVAAVETLRRFGAAIGIAGEVASNGRYQTVTCDLKNRFDTVVGPGERG